MEGKEGRGWGGKVFVWFAAWYSDLSRLSEFKGGKLVRTFAIIQNHISLKKGKEQIGSYVLKVKMSYLPVWLDTGVKNFRTLSLTISQALLFLKEISFISRIPSEIYHKIERQLLTSPDGEYNSINKPENVGPFALPIVRAKIPIQNLIAPTFITFPSVNQSLCSYEIGYFD